LHLWSSALIALAPIGSLLLPKLPAAAIDVSALSQDKTVVDDAMNAPLCYHGRIRARLVAELVKTMQKLPLISDQAIPS